MTWLRASGDGVQLALHIQPGAKKTEVVGPHGDALKIRLAAPPVDGKANEALIEFLRQRFDVPKASVSLAAGASSRSKRVVVKDITADVARQALMPRIE